MVELRMLVMLVMLGSLVRYKARTLHTHDAIAMAIPTLTGTIVVMVIL